MTKFHYGEKVRIKNNPTKLSGIAVNHPDLTPGTIVTVDRCTPDSDGDITVRLANAASSAEWAYISEDSVESVGETTPDISVGDLIRVHDTVRDITYEGRVAKIRDCGFRKWVYVGKDTAHSEQVGDLNSTDRYEFEVVERAERWPDHEGFVRITGGPNAGQRGLARRAIYSDQIVVDTDDGSTLYNDTVAGLGFNFEYVEG